MQVPAVLLISQTRQTENEDIVSCDCAGTDTKYGSSTIY
jgi:hypothetical protein